MRFSIRDRNAGTLHAQVEAELRAAMADGRLPVQAKLPSERELVSLFGVSRITIRHAIRALTQEGLLRSHPGKGVFVATPGRGYELQVFESFTETAKANGRRPGSRLIALRKYRPGLEISRPLMLRPGAEVVLLHRLRLIDDEPVALQIDWLPAADVPDLHQLDWDRDDCSLYAELIGRYGITPGKGNSTLSARLAEEDEAELLNLTRPAAVLTVDQIVFDQHDRPVNMTLLIQHPQRCPLTLAQTAPTSFHREA
ncbi:GntR family transcriptional regulator [Martelella endophytica]|uniref:GntR family transcriptional regulator n=1 Tax=Martelella endophytica TaxID=1486262 RepID=A0A0D5LVL5_MAREN|nr:GntR family transcriptional regulator [Martelella endophytica]AJY47995.1 GntR family transcriptional regulator [Martelella endophytica]